MMFLLYKLNYLFFIIIVLIIINKMKKVTINFIRHGQTSYNVLGKIQGSSDIKLTQEGIKQAYDCKINKDIEYDIAYSSSLIRAKETLGIICNNLNKNPSIIINDLIIERGYGKFEGLTEDDISNKYPDIFKNWTEDENTYIEGAETIEDVIDRIKKFLNLIVLNEFKNVLVVTHSGVLFALYKLITGTKLGDRPTNVVFPNCSSNILTIYYNNTIEELEFNIGEHTYKYSSSPTKSIISTSC